jgi:hypothetical protein
MRKYSEFQANYPSDLKNFRKNATYFDRQKFPAAMMKANGKSGKQKRAVRKSAQNSNGLKCDFDLEQAREFPVELPRRASDRGRLRRSHVGRRHLRGDCRAQTTRSAFRSFPTIATEL